MQIRYKLASRELLLVGVLLLVAGLAHAWNLFRFPYYENDEATYMAQAWSIVSQGRLTPHTYTYDHAPGGWILLAGWLQLLGGYDTFGPSINSGRVFMLVLQMTSACLLYFLARDLSRSRLAAVVTVLIFSLSPLGLEFQRRVLLDNIMTFWILVSAVLLLNRGKSLVLAALSALCFGLAVLSKENAIFLWPVLLLFLWFTYPRSNRLHGTVVWSLISVFTISLYVLFAWLNGELLPALRPGENVSGVSLLGTLNHQSGRGDFHWFWESDGDFARYLLQWWERDPFILGAGLVAMAFNLFGKGTVRSRVLAVGGAVATLLFLMRGKMVLEFYIVPIIPFLAINIGLFVRSLLQRFSTLQPHPWLAPALVAGVVAVYAGETWRPYYEDQTRDQISAVEWIKTHLPEDCYLAMDNFAYLDLKGEGHFHNADFCFKTEVDPLVQKKFYQDGPGIQYILLSHDVLRRVNAGELPMTRYALEKGEIMARFTQGQDQRLRWDQWINTKGGWAAVIKVNTNRVDSHYAAFTGAPTQGQIQTNHQELLQQTWTAYKRRFIRKTGQVMDPTRANVTTSEGQSYAMLRAVIAGDQPAFDLIWNWTAKNLQRPEDSLFCWKSERQPDGIYKITDQNTATDADQDIARALILAGRTWGQSNYQTSARAVMRGIWENEVIRVGKWTCVGAAAGYGKKSQKHVNPSCFDPSLYRVFAGMDPNHDWLSVVDGCYEMLELLQSRSSAGLFPNWVVFDRDVWRLSAREFYGETADVYGYDAFRVGWRLALDIKANREPRADIILERMAEFLGGEWKKRRILPNEYHLNGKPVSLTTSLATTAGAVVILDAAGRLTEARDLYESGVALRYDPKLTCWGGKDQYYEQNWVWLVTAHHVASLPGTFF